MSSRKLVSVQEITNIEPIEGADRIEVARILGWRVVIGKDMHLKPGDTVRRIRLNANELGELAGILQAIANEGEQH